MYSKINPFNIAITTIVAAHPWIARPNTLDTKACSPLARLRDLRAQVDLSIRCLKIGNLTATST